MSSYSFFITAYLADIYLLIYLTKVELFKIKPYEATEEF